MYDLVFKPIGNAAILIEWPKRIDDKILDDIIRFTKSIISKEEKKIRNYTSGFNSLLLQYDSRIILEYKKQELLSLYNAAKQNDKHNPSTWFIPVCYDEEFGLDLPNFYGLGLNYNDVVNLHTASIYRVFMIGFLPGFLYLGGLSEALHMERKKSPRLNIPKGSIAIGGEQTGIYPIDSPGGWQIIGRTPLTLFDLKKEIPTPIKQGDYIHFHSIGKNEYQRLYSRHLEKQL